ncbi:MAG TPA: hypothetical protein DCX46_01195 [Bacteroidetes bacterium]|nr:hypothetical protein [Bacteroidota bacterium]
MNHRICLLLSATFFLSQGAAGGGFSKLPVSARAVTLGGSLISLADDPNVLFSNPAGIARLRSINVSTSYTQLFSGISDDNLSYFSGTAVADLGLVGNLGLGLRSFSSNTWKENELVGSYAQELFDFLSIGGSAKLLQWSTPAPSGRLAVPEEGFSNVSVSFDIGAQSQVRDIVPDNDVRFGIFFGDITRPSIAANGSKHAKLDLKMSAGAAYISRVYDYTIAFHYTVAGDVRRIGIGTEIVAVKSSVLEQQVQLVVRVGGGGVQSPERQGDLNGGFGLTVAGLTFDYAFAHQTELLSVAGSHHLSLRYTF